jgi:ribosome-associated protein
MPASVDDSRSLLRRCCQALDDKKAVELRVLDVSGHSSITNYLVIATATSAPHLKALRQAMEDALEEAKAPLAGVEYSHDSGWLVVDAFELMAHLFLPEQRGYFALEGLWKDAKPVNVRDLLAGK